MPKERPPPDHPDAWIDRARSNLIRSRHALPGVAHDLTNLLTRVEREGISIPSEVREVSILTEYAVKTRYPGTVEPVTEEEHNRAVSIAERVVEWVEDRLDAGGETPDSRTD